MSEYFQYLSDYSLILFLIGIYLFYKLGKIRYNLHIKLGHEGPPPLPYLGNFVQSYIYGIFEYDKMCLKKYGKIYPYYFCYIKMAMVADEELLKQILIKESKCFTDRMDISRIGKHSDKMLTFLKGKDWERVRNLVSPTFTSGKLKKEYNDFLALMLKAQRDIKEDDPDQLKNLDSKSLTFTEIMSQSLIFLFAGYETITITLTFSAYFLAKNPDAQKEVYEEIVNTIGVEGEIKYDSLMAMPLLDAAISETLRLCPPAPRIDRVCTQDVTLLTSDNRKIIAKKDDVFAVPIYAIHRDPSIWPNPDVYDLHRFDAEKKMKRSPYSFMPFGLGPRNCVGMRFALLEVKWAIVSILQRFEIVPCAETLEKISFKRLRFATPTKPILLKLIKRN